MFRTTVYDAVGRDQATINPLGFRTTNIFDAAGRSIAIIDASMRRLTMVYDAVGQKIATMNPLGYRTSTVYDPVNRPVAVVDPRANRTTTSYDAVGQPVQVTNPLDQRTTAIFDGVGQRTLQVDARGLRITATYDPVGLQLSRRYSDGTRATFAYDPARNRMLMVDVTGRTTVVFDAVNRTRRVTTPEGRSITTLYDAVGDRAQTIGADGGRFTFTYDPVRRITGIRNPQSERTTFGYDAADRRVSKRLANGTRTSLSYDKADQTTRVVHLKSTLATISSFDYQYDPTGRRTVVTEANGERVSWVYDAAGQLQREHREGVPGYDVTHIYDTAGNRQVKIDSGEPTTFAYDNANRLQFSEDGAGRTTFAYDPAGNQTSLEKPSGDITTSLWDGDNRNTAVELPSGDRVTMLYTAAGQRVRRETFDETKVFLFDAQNILAEYDDAGFAQAVFTLEPRELGNVISQHRQDGALWTVAYFHFDALGSTDSLTDSIEVVTDSYQYSAYGDLKSSSGTSVNLFTWVGELGYVRDSDTGEYNLRARQYQPGQARFKSEDPLGQQPDANVYRYVENDPVNRVDPSGLDEAACQQAQKYTSDVLAQYWAAANAVSPLAKDLQRLTEDVESKQNKVSAQTIQVAVANERKAHAEAGLGDLESEQDDLQARSRELQLGGEEYRQLRYARDRWQAELQRAVAAYRKGKASYNEIQSIRAVIAQLNQMISSVAEERAEVEGRLQEVSDEIAAQKDEILRLDAALSAEVTQLEAAQGELEAATKALEAFREANREKLDSLAKDLAFWQDFLPRVKEAELAACQPDPPPAPEPPEEAADRPKQPDEIELEAAGRCSDCPLTAGDLQALKRDFKASLLQLGIYVAEELAEALFWYVAGGAVAGAAAKALSLTWQGGKYIIKSGGKVVANLSPRAFQALSKLLAKSRFKCLRSLGQRLERAAFNKVPPNQPAFDPHGTIGAAKPWTMKRRLKDAQLPIKGKIRYVPPKGYSPGSPLPRGPQNGYMDRFGNEWTRGPSRTKGEAFEWDIQLGPNASGGLKWASPDGHHVNVSLGGEVTH